MQLHIIAVFSCPKSDYRKTAPMPMRWHSKRPDHENVSKAVCDAGTGILWMDDSQIADCRVQKVIGAQGQAPGIYLVVNELPKDVFAPLQPPSIAGHCWDLLNDSTRKP